MHLNEPADAMPFVGLYICVASLVCTLAMAADLFQGFRLGKLWFPCRFFTINAASITVIAIAMKLPVDLTSFKHYSADLDAKHISLSFLFAMVANFLPSLGLMGDKELLINIIAFGIFIITVLVNVCIGIATRVVYPLPGILFMLPCLLAFSIALTVPASRRILELQYKELHGLASSRQEMNFSFKELEHTVKMYWMMAETGNPQFVIACSQVSSTYGAICLLMAPYLTAIFVTGGFTDTYGTSSYGDSDYQWSIKVILYLQLVGTLVGCIAPAFRCFTVISYFEPSKKWSKNHLNVFKVEKQWIERLQKWKRIHVHSHIPGRHCKKVFHMVKNMILNMCVSLQIMAAVICKTICLIPRCFLILFSYCWYFCKSLFKRFKQGSKASYDNLHSEVDKYSSYVLLVEEEAKLSKRILTNMLRSITKLLKVSAEKVPRNLMKLLKKSTGFNGVVQFDNDEVPPLNQEETQQNCWSLVAVTLTAIAIALPNISNSHVKELLASMREGLQIVRHVEETLNENGDLVEARKRRLVWEKHLQNVKYTPLGSYGIRLWTEVEVYSTWLEIHLQKKARMGKTSKEILRWLGDEAVKNVIEFKSCKKGSLNRSLHKFIASSSMYRISQTILLHCNKQQNCPNDEELFEWISTIIADLLCACFANLPRVIKMKCHHDAIEKRGDSIRSAAQLLGKSKKILEILEARQLPNLDVESMGYIDKWHALLMSEILNGSASSNQATASSNGSVIVSIVY